MWTVRVEQDVMHLFDWGEWGKSYILKTGVKFTTDKKNLLVLV